MKPAQHLRDSSAAVTARLHADAITDTGAAPFPPVASPDPVPANTGDSHTPDNRMWFTPEGINRIP